MKEHEIKLTWRKW